MSGRESPAPEARGRWYFEIPSYITKPNRENGRERAPETVFDAIAAGKTHSGTEAVRNGLPDVKGEA